MDWRVFCGDCREILKKVEDDSVDCIVTSPPYWGLRDYGVDGQIGLEPTLGEYLQNILNVTVELRRVLKPNGTMFWVHGDSYFGSGRGKRGKTAIDCRPGEIFPGIAEKFRRSWGKCLTLQGFRLAVRMVDEQGWFLRNCVVWEKPNGMPESVKDRFSRRWEVVFLFTKSKKYFFDLDVVRVSYKQSTVQRSKYPWRGERCRGFPGPSIGGVDGKMVHPKGKNPGDVWSIPTQPFKGAHFAVFPEKLVERCILSGCPPGGLVLDPFMGTGTVGVVALRLGRKFLGIEINRKYIEMAKERVKRSGFFGKIRRGAIVGQDFWHVEWDGRDVVFWFRKLTDSLFKGVAPGYGERGNYGNGAVYVFDIDDIILCGEGGVEFDGVQEGDVSDGSFDR